MREGCHFLKRGHRIVAKRGEITQHEVTHPPRPGSGYRSGQHPGREDCREYLRGWPDAYTNPLFSSAMIVADSALYHGRKLRTISTSLRAKRGENHNMLRHPHIARQ